MHMFSSQSKTCNPSPKSPRTRYASAPHIYSFTGSKHQSSDQILHELIERLEEIANKCREEPSIENLMMKKFEGRDYGQDNGLSKMLEDCLQFCVEQYHTKQQQLQICLEIATHFHHLIQSQSQTIGQQANRLQHQEEELLQKYAQSKQLHSCIDQLENQLHITKKNSQDLIIQYQVEKDQIKTTTEAMKEVLRENFQFDRIELGLAVKQLKEEVEVRGNKIMDYQGQIAKLNHILATKDTSIDDLQAETKALNQQIDSLTKQIRILNCASNNKTVKQQQQPIKLTMLSDLVQNITLPLTHQRQQVVVEPLQLPKGPEQVSEDWRYSKNELRKVRSVGKNKQRKPDVQTESSTRQLDDGAEKCRSKVSAKMMNNIKKMRSVMFAEPQSSLLNGDHADAEVNHQKQHETERERENPRQPQQINGKYREVEIQIEQDVKNQIEGQKNNLEMEKNTILQRCLYKVKSIQRLSEVSQVYHVGSNMNFYLHQSQQPQKPEKKQKVSIGLNTQPNEEDTISLNFSTPLRSNKYNNMSNLATSRSCFQSGVGFEEPYFKSENHGNSRVNDKSKKDMQGSGSMISNIINMLVSRRTHKKKKPVSIAQIQKKRKIEQQQRQKLSKPFMSTIQTLKSSFIGHEVAMHCKSRSQFPPPISKIDNKTETRKSLSMSMINFGESTSYNHKQMMESVIEPTRNMKKGNHMSMMTRLEDEKEREKEKTEETNKSSFFSSLFNFAVRNRIKKN